ncbi:MAG TPA: hypothetical protein VF292_02820 [Rhodanobacteraceae bacterium]
MKLRHLTSHDWFIIAATLYAALAVGIVLDLFCPESAHAATTAQSATVIAVAPGTATQQQQYAIQQQEQQEYGYQQQDGYTQRNSRAIIGGILGTALGALAGRHSSAGWYGAGIGGAIGTAVGNHLDANAERKRAQEVAFLRAHANVGYQVVLKLAHGGNAAVFVRGELFVPGEKVWLIGQNEIIPASN